MKKLNRNLEALLEQAKQVENFVKIWAPFSNQLQQSERS
jgi:hypothetical protein